MESDPCVRAAVGTLHDIFFNMPFFNISYIKVEESRCINCLQCLSDVFSQHSLENRVGVQRVQFYIIVSFLLSILNNS